MGMYLHINVSPTLDPTTSQLQVWCNYVDHHGESHSFTAVESKVLSPAYNDSRAIEHWVISTVANLSSAVASAMVQSLLSGQPLLIPEANKRKIP